MTLQPTNHSEVAILLSQINAEYDAAHQALYGLASGSARHDFISARMKHIQSVSQHLIDTIGKEAALPLIVAAMDRLTS
jgi:hypothetical protein